MCLKIRISEATIISPLMHYQNDYLMTITIFGRAIIRIKPSSLDNIDDLMSVINIQNLEFLGR